MVEKQNLSKLCCFCFDYLESYLNETEPKLKFPDEYKSLKFPLFVTWTKGKNQILRGCIGTFEAESLEENLTKFTLLSALNDDRFKPINKKEIKNLHVCVSLLTDFEDCKDCYDWEIGVHGIEIYYKKYNATFLPEVALEEKWDIKTTLEQLLIKSGCKKQLSQIESEIKTIRYKSIKHELSYNQYKESLSISG